MRPDLAKAELDNNIVDRELFVLGFCVAMDQHAQMY